MVAPFRQAFADKEFVVTAEVGPPKGTEISELIEHIELLKDKVDGLNVTDNQSSVMRISSLAVCRMIVDHGGGLLSIYAHASAVVVQPGENVFRGTLLGQVGETGSLRGPYLYFELRADGQPTDPRPWLRRR